MNRMLSVAVVIFANTVLLGQAGQTPPPHQSQGQHSSMPELSALLATSNILPGISNASAPTAPSSALSLGMLIPPPVSPVSASSTTATGAADAGSTPVYSFTLTYAGNSNIVRAQDSLNGDWSYTYDDLSRLLTATTPPNSGPGQRFVYDAYGNRWQENVTQGTAPTSLLTFDNSNRIVGAQYDALGNLIKDGRHTYVYDAENRVICVDPPAQGTCDNAPIQYTYDARGRRVSKTVNSQTTESLFDLAGRVVAERNPATGPWNRVEVYAGGRHLATYTPATTYFRHSDWLGSSRVKTLPDGTVAEMCTNFPFGDGLSCQQAGAQYPTQNPFAGYERDQETGLDQTLFRKYSSAQGRWTTPDPYLGSMDLTNPQSLNRYAYVLNNPVNLRDRLGLGSCVYYTDDGKNVEEVDNESTEGGCHDTGGCYLDTEACFEIAQSIDVAAPDPIMPIVAINPLDWVLNGIVRPVGSEIKQQICSAIPNGWATGISGSIGALGGGVGGFEIVKNYDSGEVSEYFFGGLQGGWWNGVISGSIYQGAVWGLNSSNSNYSGGFSGLNLPIPSTGGLLSFYAAASSGGLGGSPAELIPNPRQVDVAGFSIGKSLIGSAAGLNVTNYTQPQSLGRFTGFDISDYANYRMRQVCK